MRFFCLTICIFLTSGHLQAGDFFAVKYNSDIEKNEIWRVNTTNSSQTKLAEIRFPSNGWNPASSFLSEKTGELFLKNAEGYFNVYNPKTNSFRELLNGPILTEFQQAFEIPDKFIDEVISISSDDAEIRIDEANNTVNIDNAAISDGEGRNMISLKEDGAVHIGENSLITLEQGSIQKLYAEGASGKAIDINVTNGSDLLIDGVSVMGGIAMNAALSSLPSFAPEGTTICGGSIGGLADSVAAAGGCVQNYNSKLSYNYGVSTPIDDNGSLNDYSFKVGFTYKFGNSLTQSKGIQSSSLETRLFKQQAEIGRIAKREANKDAKIAEYEARITQLEKARLFEKAELSRQMSNLEERFEKLLIAVAENNNKLAGLVQ